MLHRNKGFEGMHKTHVSLKAFLFQGLTINYRAGVAAKFDLLCKILPAAS
jgi:hypothetical protein